jgi:hypothetical protein
MFTSKSKSVPVLRDSVHLRHTHRQQTEKSKTFCARRTDEPLALADSTYAEVELGSVRAPVPLPDERPLILL